MIVGFDPGTTCAIAVINLEGKLVFMESFKGGVPEAIEKVRSAGTPVLVASDKRQMEGVEKLAAAFSAVAFFPDHDLSVREKQEMTRGYPCRDSHERDALSAALYAYRKHRRVIQRIRKREGEIFKILLKKEEANISNAVRPRVEKERRVRKRDVDLASRVKDLERRLDMLNDLVAIKDEEIRGLKEELEKAENRNKKGLARDRKIRDLEARVARLRREKEVRIRLEKELVEAHSRISRIEAELDALERAKPEQKEDIKAKILKMIKEYKERFR